VVDASTPSAKVDHNHVVGVGWRGRFRFAQPCVSATRDVLVVRSFSDPGRSNASGRPVVLGNGPTGGAKQLDDDSSAPLASSGAPA